jgi:hypothetical protein
MVGTDVTKLAGSEERLYGFLVRVRNLNSPFLRAFAIVSFNQEHHVESRKGR